MATKRRQLSKSKGRFLLISTRPKFPKRLGSRKRAAGLSAAALFLFACFCFSLANYQPACWPIRPEETRQKPQPKHPNPLRRPWPTATFTQPPTLTPLPEIHLPLVNGPGGTPQGTPKALPTGTLLTLDEISATLQAKGTGASQARPSFWIYLFIIFVVAAAAVVAVLITLIRQKGKTETNEGQEEP